MSAEAIEPVVACGDAFPPNRHLTCVRVPGHEGRHVWVSDLPQATASSALTWRDHVEGCSCAYCEPVAEAASR
jgi:hypothetical protein